MSDVKRIPRKLRFYKFLITFSYETIKGYYREQVMKWWLGEVKKDNNIEGQCSMF